MVKLREGAERGRYHPSLTKLEALSPQRTQRDHEPAGIPNRVCRHWSFDVGPPRPPKKLLMPGTAMAIYFGE